MLPCAQALRMMVSTRCQYGSFQCVISPSTNGRTPSKVAPSSLGAPFSRRARPTGHDGRVEPARRPVGEVQLRLLAATSATMTRPRRVAPNTQQRGTVLVEEVPPVRADRGDEMVIRLRLVRGGRYDCQWSILRWGRGRATGSRGSAAQKAQQSHDSCRKALHADRPAESRPYVRTGAGHGSERDTQRSLKGWAPGEALARRAGPGHGRRAVSRGHAPPRCRLMVRLTRSAPNRSASHRAVPMSTCTMAPGWCWPHRRASRIATVAAGWATWSRPRSCSSTDGAVPARRVRLWSRCRWVTSATRRSTRSSGSWTRPDWSHRAFSRCPIESTTEFRRGWRCRQLRRPSHVGSAQPSTCWTSPSHPMTARSGTPRMSSTVAAVCRASWSRISRTPAAGEEVLPALEVVPGG